MAEAGWILSWTTILQALVFATVLLRPARIEVRANRILFLLLLVIVIEKADQVFLASGAVLEFPRFAMIGNLFGALIAPLTYFHIRARIDPAAQIGWRQSWAFAPFALLALYAIATYHRFDEEVQRQLFVSGDILSLANTRFIPLAGDAISLGFLGAAIGTLIAHDGRVRNWFSTIENRTLSGLRTVLSLMALVIAVHAAWTLTGHTGVGVFLSLGHLLMVNALVLGALTASRDTAQAAQAQRGVAGSATTPEQAETLAAADRMLRESHLYKDPDLTIARLARRLSVPTRQLSEAINQAGGMNFHTFVNTARIDVAKSTLKAEPHWTILDIAIECGFNSKSTFNDAFRRQTGITPSQFRANT